MITSTDLQRNYVKIFSLMRNYVWTFDIVECLADLEVATYNAFINVEEVRRCFDRLKSLIRDVTRNDEELKEALDKFQSILDLQEEYYYRILKVQEAL